MNMNRFQPSSLMKNLLVCVLMYETDKILQVLQRKVGMFLVSDQDCLFVKFPVWTTKTWGFLSIIDSISLTWINLQRICPDKTRVWLRTIFKMSYEKEEQQNSYWLRWRDSTFLHTRMQPISSRSTNGDPFGNASKIVWRKSCLSVKLHSRQVSSCWISN